MSWCRALSAVLLGLSLAPQPFAAQAQEPAPADKSAPATERPAPSCEAERALQLVREQLSEAKAFANGGKRVAVMARAAELLWPFDEAQARAVFAEAFEVASSHYREHGQESTVRKSSRADGDNAMPGLRHMLTDPRVVVIRAVARRDPAWAQKLSARSAEDTRQRAAEADAKTGREAVAERLMTVATSLQASDPALALAVARESLRHPASRFLSQFIYNVARTDRAAADAFYADALRAYSTADLASLLQLSGYPFGLSQNLGLRSGYNGAGVPPKDFAPSPDLQRRFVSAFLRLAARRLEAAAGQPPPSADSYQQPPSDAELIYGALVSLENVYGPSDKNFLALAAPHKQAAGAMLSGNGLRRAEGGAQRAPRTEPTPPPDPSSAFDSVLANAERIKDPDAHDRAIIMGLFGMLGRESLERLEAAADKLKDEGARRQFLETAYFEKSLRASREGRPDEAARFAEKVGSLEQRAGLAGELAAAELKQSGAAPLALAVAESVYKSAQGAPESEEKVRALVRLAHLYLQLEPPRAAQVLTEAVAAINRVPDVDPMRPFITRAVDGRKFNVYTSYASPGFNLEAVLRESGGRDFEAALLAALGLDDKHLRALAVLTLASKCLEAAPKPERPKKPARGGRKQ
ncbi:MAG TPA: hypothetical protein VN282_22435 [Pyrinomonadaceae bacterium]|nr:hypothetical protein [Pyrinomonadaceae bacterium]